MPRRSRARKSSPCVRPRSRTRTCRAAARDVRPPVLVAPQDHFGVGSDRNRRPQRLELAPQLAEVVDLAVERQREVRHLRTWADATVGEVDDGEPAMPEDCGWPASFTSRNASDTRAIGTAMRLCVGHGPDDGCRVDRRLVPKNRASDPAHVREPAYPWDRELRRWARATGSTPVRRRP